MANTEYRLSIEYSASRVVIDIDGVGQFNLGGQFSDGRFGLYSCAQGSASGPLFSNFKVEDLGTGDLTGDASVDGNDFLLWQTQLGLEGVHASDADGSGMVDGQDLEFWTSSYPAIVALTAPADTAPEPVALTLIALATIPLLVNRRRAH